MNGQLNYNELNTARLNNSTAYPYSIYTEARRDTDSKPKTKIEFIDTMGNVTDITDYYLEGAQFEQIKERAPDEIQAGDFDIVLANHDDKFSEYVASSLIYGTQYHLARIKVSQGFILPDGTESYIVQAIGYIDELEADDGNSKVTFRCRDLIRLILDSKLHPRPTAEVPAKNTANAGNGVVSTIETKPFKTINETWTLTCTTGGADGAAIFSVVGSVTGSKGNATSGTEFSTGSGTGGIKFTITAGSAAWVIGDIFTFSTKQYPQWSTVNIIKIIWSVLTGYNYDTDTQEAWSAQVLSLDHTQSSSNTQIDYDAFVEAIDQTNAVGFLNLTGYAAYDEDIVDFLQGLILLTLGSIFTIPDGRISIKTYVPQFEGTSIRLFSDYRKIIKLGYIRAIDEVINYVSVHYKKTNVWEFSDEDINYDGNYVATNTASSAKYGQLTEGFSSRWFSSNGNHVQDFANKLVQKYAEPPLNIIFTTGLDGMFSQIGDFVEVTDSKYNFDSVVGEIAKITKKFDDRPAHIDMVVRRDSDLDFIFGFIGSEVDEGDGVSPQTDDWDSATDIDKLFAYFSKIGDSTVDYRMF